MEVSETYVDVFEFKGVLIDFSSVKGVFKVSRAS